MVERRKKAWRWNGSWVTISRWSVISFDDREFDYCLYRCLILVLRIKARLSAFKRHKERRKWIEWARDTVELNLDLIVEWNRYFSISYELMWIHTNFTRILHESYTNFMRIFYELDTNSFEIYTNLGKFVSGGLVLITQIGT